jgi:GGDEF domain-containing protein
MTLEPPITHLTTDRAACLEDCYSLALQSTGQYALDFNCASKQEFQEHLTALRDRVAGASLKDLPVIQASFRGELRAYKDKAQGYIDRLKADLAGATEAMSNFATAFVDNGIEAEAKVRAEVGKLEVAAESDDLVALKECVLSATHVIAQSYDDLNKVNQLVIAELQHEIRLLHKEMESEKKAAWSDPESGAWVKRKLDDKVDGLLKTQEAFCVILLVVSNLQRLEAQCSRPLVQGALAAMVKRCGSVAGEEALVSRVDHDMFAVVLELNFQAAQVIATEISERVSARYSVQENGIAQNIVLRVQCSLVDRPQEGNPDEFRRRFSQMVGNGQRETTPQQLPA